MKKKLGIKIRKVRESLQLTQEQVSKGTGLSSEFISLIEKGKRYPSIQSIEKISNYLNKNISYFFEEETDPFKRIMKDKGITRSTKSELRTFKKYCDEYLHMEKILGNSLEEAPLYSSPLPEIMAAEERKRLGLGTQSVKNIFTLLEFNGLRILRQSMKTNLKIAGAFVYFKNQQAGFALINTNQSYAKQIITAAHEYCHYLKDREFISLIDNTDIFVDEYLPLYPSREKFAHLFSLHFLISEEQINSFMNKEFHKKDKKIENIIILKRYLEMPMEIVLKTLLRMKHISSSEYNEYSKQRYLEYEKSLFGYVKAETAPYKKRTKTIPSDRYKTLAVQAYKDQKF
ncbi:MAG: XRE family transcriptional regulator [Candidatus Aminicenantes bacterium]